MGFFGLVRNENVFAYFIVEKCSVWFWLNSHNNIFQFATHTKSVRHYHFPSFIWYFVQSAAQKKISVKVLQRRKRERKKYKTERKMHKSDKYSGNPKTKSPTQIKSRKKNLQFHAAIFNSDILFGRFAGKVRTRYIHKRDKFNAIERPEICGFIAFRSTIFVETLWLYD